MHLYVPIAAIIVTGKISPIPFLHGVCTVIVPKNLFQCVNKMAFADQSVNAGGKRDLTLATQGAV